MTPKQVKQAFDKLPSKRKQVLIMLLKGHSKIKIAFELCDGSTDAVQQNLRQLYKDFNVQEDKQRKLPALFALIHKVYT